MGPGSSGIPSNGERVAQELRGSQQSCMRRIEQEWLYSAEQLALDISDYTNNSSLVLAFELGAGGKVLLFAAMHSGATGCHGAKKRGRMATRRLRRVSCLRTRFSTRSVITEATMQL